MKNITIKEVQIHFECVCGINSVYTEELLIKWEELSKLKIRRKKDKKTGKPFLLKIIKSNQCFCNDEEL